jgi:hypothetical protein
MTLGGYISVLCLLVALGLVISACNTSGLPKGAVGNVGNAEEDVSLIRMSVDDARNSLIERVYYPEALEALAEDLTGEARELLLDDNGKFILENIRIEPVLIKSLTADDLSEADLEAVAQVATEHTVTRLNEVITSGDERAKRQLEVFLHRVNVLEDSQNSSSKNLEDAINTFAVRQGQIRILQTKAAAGDFYIAGVFHRDIGYLTHHIFSAEVLTGGGQTSAEAYEPRLEGFHSLFLTTREEAIAKLGSQDVELVSLGGMSSALYGLQHIYWFDGTRGVNVLDGQLVRLSQRNNALSLQGENRRITTTTHGEGHLIISPNLNWEVVSE